VEVAGSNPASSTFNHTPSILVAFELKKKGYAEKTIAGYAKRLKHLEQNTDINTPETVKAYIANQADWSNPYKESMVNAYGHYVEYYGLTWKKPFYNRPERLPNVPTTEQLNKIIGASGKKYSLVFSILRDTGLRPVELARSCLKNFDLERGLVSPQTAKGGSGRVLKLPASTIAMLKEYIGRQNVGINEKFFPSTDVMSHVWMRIRNRLAKKLAEPELKKYRLYDLRHYYATMLYYRTKDILLVKQQLGHRRIEHTLVYTHLINFQTDEYTCRCAYNLQEATALIEAGFEYVTEMDSVKLFKKRK